MNTPTPIVVTAMVNLSEDAAFAVYDGEGVCVNYTTVSREYSTKLPANGKVVFIGRPGDVFGIDIR